MRHLGIFTSSRYLTARSGANSIPQSVSMRLTRGRNSEAAMQEEEDHLGLDVKASISWRVKSGFYSSDEITETITQSIIDEQPNVSLQQTRRMVRAVVASQWAEQLERQRSWLDQPTISDKLAKAFDSLERSHKILAKMNFACCQTCGVAEISEDRDEATRGYVFFHQQAMETAISGSKINLVFGSFTKSEKKNLGVGEIIVKSLRRAGLQVEWEKNAKTRILVRCGEWRRRFQEHEEIEDVGDDDFDSECMSTCESESEPEPDTDSDLELDGQMYGQLDDSALDAGELI